MKRKNGFTLIELLAVIVILAIIALIATPTILGVIEKAKKGALKDSALAYIDAVEKYMLLHEMDNTKYPYNLETGKTYYVIPDSEIEIATISKSILPVVYAEEAQTPVGDIYLEDFIEVKGEAPVDGYVVIGEKNTVTSALFVVNNYEVTCENSDKCEVTGKLDSSSVEVTSVTINGEIYVGEKLQLTATILPEDTINKNVVWTSSNETIATVNANGLVTGVKEGNIIITATESNGKKANIGITIKKYGITMEAAKEGETHKGIVYLDPTNLKNVCNASNSSINATETKTGCMKWYIFDDSGSNYKLILDHNTTARIKWNDSNSNVAYESSNLKAVVDDLVTTSGWVLEPRLISAEEVNTITGKTGFDSTNASSHYYFDTKTVNRGTFNSTTRSKYDWLYNNLYKCKTDSTDYGCTLEDNNSYTGYGTAGDGETYAYWTSTTLGSAGSGSFVWYVYGDGSLGRNNANNAVIGIRPVITISKSIVS